MLQFKQQMVRLILPLREQVVELTLIFAAIPFASAEKVLPPVTPPPMLIFPLLVLAEIPPLPVEVNGEWCY
jgi:hypothetical protein